MLMIWCLCAVTDENSQFVFGADGSVSFLGVNAVDKGSSATLCGQQRCCLTSPVFWSAGDTFVWCFIIALFVYIGGGVIVGGRTGAVHPPIGQLGLLQVHPHWHRWQAMLSLVLDGVAFTRGLRQGAGVGHGVNTGMHGAKRKSGEKHGRKGKREQVRTKEEHLRAPVVGKRASGSQPHADKLGGTQSTAVEKGLVPGTNAIPGPGGQQITASAGGGRWVRVDM